MVQGWRRPRTGRLRASRRAWSFLLTDRRSTLWLVSPVYLDVESYVLVRKRALEELAAIVPEFESIRCVVVDDTGGTDPEISKLSAYDDVRVVTAPFNLGHQRALVFGLRT